MITLAGPIGAGKTTLTRLLANQLQSQAFEEPVGNNPILPLFYKGNEEAAKARANGDKNATNRYAFLQQIYFLYKRFAMIKQAMKDDNNVLDRSIYEDAIFMKMNTEMGNATQIEYDTYKHLLDEMLEELPYAAHKKAPDLMIYIKLDYPTMLKHIETRNRPYEQIDNDPSLSSYYKQLLKEYTLWTTQYSASPLITIDATQYDFVNNINDTKKVLIKIYNALIELKKINHNQYETLITKTDYLTYTDVPHTN